MVELSALQNKPPLLVFADDWGRHPSSCQHLMRYLSNRRRIRWVNTIGMRPPRFDAVTCARALQKLNDWSRRGDNTVASLPRGLSIHNPKMWPWMHRSVDRRINCALLLRQLQPVISGCGAPPVAVTTLPIVADLMGRLLTSGWIYYCVDDFSKWPGLERESLEAMEREVVQRADMVICASQNLQQRLAGWERSSELLTHGVELEHWQFVADAPQLEALARLERPIAAFWGLIDARIDPAMILRTAHGMQRGTLLLVGPQQNPDPSLFSHARVVWLPAVDYAALPSIAQAADVLIMPYADMPVTRAMQPLKLKEYLATPKPVVSRDLPAVREWADCLDVASDADAFAAAVRKCLVEGISAEQLKARGRLLHESWRAKAIRFEELIEPVETPK